MKFGINQALSQTITQLYACRLAGAKPLSEPMLEYCKFEP